MSVVETAEEFCGQCQEPLFQCGCDRAALRGTWAKLRTMFMRYRRVAIAGGPRTGKTTLADLCAPYGRRVFHGDDLMNLGWSESSAALARQVNYYAGTLVVEGVQVPRALRKGMTVDAVLWLDTPHVPLTPQQQAMAKGCKTVFDEWQALFPTIPVIRGI